MDAREAIETMRELPVPVPGGLVLTAADFLRSLAGRLPCPMPKRERMAETVKPDGMVEMVRCGCDRCHAEMLSVALVMAASGEFEGARHLSNGFVDHALADTRLESSLPHYAVS